MTSPAELHARSMIVDLHAHPTMKTYFGDAELKTRYTPGPGMNPFELRTSHPSLVAGGIDVLWSSVYVPEQYLKKDCWVMDVVAAFSPHLREAFESPADTIAEKMIRHMEVQVEAVNDTKPAREMAVVKSNADLDVALRDGKIAVIHTIEGAHALNGDVANVERFKQLGVASITLAHFYPNGIAPPVEGIPKDVSLRLLGCFRFEEDVSLGLTTLGKEVVEEMLRLGVVVDLTHCTPRAREDAYAIAQGKGRPLTFTHVGAYEARPADMNPKDPEIRAIADLGGVIGVIFYDYWLTIQKYAGSDKLKHIIPNVDHLVRVGGEDVVAFGSDFDGMTDPPDDLTEPAEWPNLTAALASEGFSDAQIEKFLGGNARRMMRDAWG